MEKEPARVVQGTPALNLSPELIELFGVHDGADPWRHCADEMDQVQAAKCSKTKLGDKQIGGGRPAGQDALQQMSLHTAPRPNRRWFGRVPT